MNEMVVINILLAIYLVVIFKMSYYSYREAAALIKHFMVSYAYRMQLQKIIKSQIRDMVICSILFVLNIVCVVVLW